MVILKNELSFTTWDQFHTLWEQKIFSDDVLDVFILIFMESLKKKLYPYKKHVAVTCRLVVLMSKSEHIAEVFLTFMEEATLNNHEMELLLLPIIFNTHFHLVVLDKEKKEYIYYSFTENRIYEADTKNMVRITYISWICFPSFFS